MRRRTFIVTLPFAAMPLGVLAQRAAMPRVGLLWLRTPQRRLFREALVAGMGEHGWVEGKNFVLDEMETDGYAAMVSAAEGLVARKASVIVTWGYTSLRAARRASATIPVIMNAGIDPVKNGFAASLARPGGSVTGITTLNTELQGKQAELLQQALPRARRVSAILDPTSGAQTGYFGLIETEARRLGMEFFAVEIRRAEELEPAVAAAAREKRDALYVVPSTMLQGHSRRIADLALKHRLPSFAYSSEYADAGVMVTYGVNRAATFRRTGDYVARILKGATPADLPIEQASEFELVINMRTAKALGVAIPQAVILRATRTIG